VRKFVNVKTRLSVQIPRGKYQSIAKEILCTYFFRFITKRFDCDGNEICNSVKYINCKKNKIDGLFANRIQFYFAIYK